MCISFAGSIANLASVPGQALEFRARAMANSQNEAVIALEKEVADLQEEYIKKLESNFKSWKRIRKPRMPLRQMESLIRFLIALMNSRHKYKTI